MLNTLSLKYIKNTPLLHPVLFDILLLIILIDVVFNIITLWFLSQIDFNVKAENALSK